MTPFTQFLIVCAILFCITVCVVDRIEVTRHNRLLADDALQSWKAEYDARVLAVDIQNQICDRNYETPEDLVRAQNEAKINKVLRAE